MKRKTIQYMDAGMQIDKPGKSKLFRTNKNEPPSDIYQLGVSLEMLTLAQLRNKFAANPLNVDLDGDNSHRCSESNCCECELVYSDNMRICQYMRTSRFNP